VKGPRQRRKLCVEGMVGKPFVSTMLLAGALSALPLAASAARPPGAAIPPAAHAPPITRVPMRKDGGVYVVPVSLNGTVSLECIVDSGASDVNIPAAAFRRLVQAGTIQKSDFLGYQDYTLADGSSERGRLVRIHSLRVGNLVVKDVVASVGGEGSSALLGQSFLERFASWSLDNGKHALVLLGSPLTPPKPTAPGGPHPVDGPVSVANVGGNGPGATPPSRTRPDGPAVAQGQGPGGERMHHGPQPEAEDGDGGLASQLGR